ncbi:organic cation transporter protein [Galendromus occidentalis]|uniref:Organic cation transporter protein n=1 Tax=Galendromus occidentalis TaxID=34638 RepID=A0AAJ7SH56_9ACAR|nr:organic cation transporter protein [Galendromus occidentalis]
MEEFLGKTGKWHWPVLIMNAYVAVPHAWFVMAPSFSEPNKLQYWCAPPENVTLHQWRLDNQDLSLNCTARYDGIVTKCSQWEFDTSEVYRPLQMDFGIVCDKAVLTSIHRSLLMGGLMAGNFIFSHFSDWYGRKPLLGFCTFIQVLFNLLLLLAPTYGWILAITVITACGYGGLQNIPFTLAMESVGQPQRAFVSTCEEVGWIIGLIILPICTYFVRDWRYLQLCIIAPVLLTVVNCFCDESPRWLVARGKIPAARRLLERIATKNGMEDPVTEVNKVLKAHKQETVNGRASVVDLFREWDIAKMAISFYIQLAMSVLLYFSLIFFIVDIGDNPHLNLFVSGLLELPLIPIVYFALKFLKRKTLYLWVHLPCFASTLTLAFLPPGFVWTQVILASIGKWASQVLFSLLVVHAAECFPTEVRSVAVGTSFTMSRIGAIISPFMAQLTTKCSSLLCAAVVVVAYLWTFVLPETSTSSLPDTLHETRCKMQSAKLKSQNENPSNETAA